jgi:pimeloyl-ACP methyl ester carboxylesterase
MAHLTTDDGVKLYYEETGAGIPIVFVHELAGDVRAYEPQVRHFARRYRCITYNARGYPPSDVPEEAERYSQNRARDDILAVLNALQIDKAHVVGLSMGGFATLHFGFTYPARAARWSSADAVTVPLQQSASNSLSKPKIPRNPSKPTDQGQSRPI